jgi:xylose isomerase
MESNRNLDAVVKLLKEEQQRTGIKLLWATACLFINPRFVHGAATSPNADVFVYAAAQVKKAIKLFTSCVQKATFSGATAKGIPASGTPI